MDENELIDLYPLLKTPEELRELVARLICMGVTPPVSLVDLTAEKVEEIITGMPSLHAAHTRIRDRFLGNVEIWQFDVTRIGAESRLAESLNKYSLTEIPAEQIFSKEYSPGAWYQFLHHDFQTVDLEVFRDSLYCWDIDFDPVRIEVGFRLDSDEAEKRAEELLNERRLDLIARLTCMGIVSPLDYYYCTPEKAEDIIRRLPPLVDLELIIKQPGQPVERLHFINLAEYNFRSITTLDIYKEYHPGKDIYDDPRNNRFDSEMYPTYNAEMKDEDDLNDAELNPDVPLAKITRANDNDKSLHLQVTDFFDRNPGLESFCTDRRLTLRSGYAWIDYFNQDLTSAVPTISKGIPNFSRLKRAFSSWEFDSARETINWKAGFQRDFGKNREEARMTFFRSLFFKLTQAEVIPRIPRDEWFSMDSNTAERIAEKRIPLLAEQECYGDWLKLFNQPLPDDPMFLIDLQSSFHAADIPFSREAVCSAFQNQTLMKGKKAMSINPQNEQRYLAAAIKNMINRREMEPIPDDFLDGMSLPEIRELLRENPNNRITEDQSSTLSKKEKFGYLKDVVLPPGGIAGLSRPEASFYINNTPLLTREQMTPDNPATDETRRLFNWLTRDMPEERLTPTRWANISEEELQFKIQRVQSKMKISEFQLDHMTRSLADGSFPMETASKYINAPVIGPEQIAQLNYFQAAKIMEDCPISPKQLQYFKEMSDHHPQKPADPERMTYGEARKLSEKIGIRGKTLVDSDPIIGNQVAAILDAMDMDKSLKTDKPVENMTYGEAKKFLDNLDPSEGQLKKINFLIRDTQTGSLIPDYIKNSLRKGQASDLIDILTKKDRHGNIDTKALEELVSKIDPPATEEQLEIIKVYQDKGAKIKVPKEPTYRQLDKLILEEHQKQPINQQQLATMKGWVNQGTVNAKVLENPEKLTQGKFAEIRLTHMTNLRKQNNKAQPAPDQAKTPEVPGMSR